MGTVGSTVNIIIKIFYLNKAVVSSASGGCPSSSEVVDECRGGHSAVVVCCCWNGDWPTLMDLARARISRTMSVACLPRVSAWEKKIILKYFKIIL
jgi:hypothetical protein